MSQIRFRFDPEKAIAVLAYLAQCGVTGLDPMKTAKLLYLADREHLLRYGRPITGDHYVVMEHGPVPSHVRNMFNARILGDPDDPEMLEYFDVEQKGKYPVLIAKREPDMDVFSDSDLEVLNEIAANYGARTAWQLRDLAHEFPEVSEALSERLALGRGKVDLAFESILRDVPAMAAVVAATQDDRDFSEALAW